MRRDGALLASVRALTVGVLFLAVIAAALALDHPWTACPHDWSDASRLLLAQSGGYVVLDGREFQVSGDALLDYMPRVAVPGEPLPARGHPLSISASISAASRDALGQPEFTCFQVSREREVWKGRPSTYAVQTAADGYPPGAPSPVPNEAWRMASLSDGPEWPDGGSIDLELWATVNGRHYVFVLPPFGLMRGG